MILILQRRAIAILIEYSSFGVFARDRYRLGDNFSAIACWKRFFLLLFLYNGNIFICLTQNILAIV
ncbi:MAG: hypothetical protein SAL07_01725 [Oscillatoria sp. PMC 1051.18]|nr:hypothetical protein [Oscillatoria sp. PMC 1050.18]MEC5028604.1 hypothetical protein [Oscillatoria sp. PMC 1051.18]